MKILLIVLFLLPTIFISSCATTWVGKSEDSVIRRFGIPEAEKITLDGKLIQFSICEGGMFLPGTVCRKRLFLIKDKTVEKDLGFIER